MVIRTPLLFDTLEYINKALNSTSVAIFSVQSQLDSTVATPKEQTRMIPKKCQQIVFTVQSDSLTDRHSTFC